jgi:hypothetical protein
VQLEGNLDTKPRLCIAKTEPRTVQLRRGGHQGKSKSMSGFAAAA